VEQNGLLSAEPGINLVAGAYIVGGVGFQVINNMVRDNNSVPTGDQIVIGHPAVIRTTAVILGNDCIGLGGTAGNLHLAISGGTTFSIVGGQGGGVFWNWQTGTPPFASGSALDLNRAILVYP
jgi:hypothetical protein